jgi:hypothetical protein
MPLAPELLGAVTASDPAQAWGTIADYLWNEFSAPIKAADADSEVVKRDKDLTELDNVLSGSAWDLWTHFDASVPKASQAIIDFWSATHGGKAILILDGLSLRESPWLLQQAALRGYKLHLSGIRASELPAETTPFAQSLGFGQRSALENNRAGSAHKLKGAFTVSCNLPWLDCVEMVGAHEAVVFWHHWPDERMHDLAGPGASLHKLAKETQTALCSDDFWALVQRLTTGRRLIITSDHGYAACGHFPDLADRDQVAYMKNLFKSGRSAASDGQQGSWVPPIDLELTTAHGRHQYVLGRKKWKSAAGYPTLQHGGLSLLEVFVSFIEISR